MLRRFVLLFALGWPIVSYAQPNQCTYETFRWNVPQRRAVAIETVQKAYTALTADEVDAATGCTVCEEDQVWVRLPGLEPFRLCQHLAPQVEAALRLLQQQGVPLFHVTGYRVGRTRGDLDGAGNRTRFSNHAYGIALDVNREQNGLYDGCVTFGPHCRLIQGGPWQPGQPGSLTPEGPLVQALLALGFQWGGTLPGRQKDFMHFSPSGD